MSILTKDKGKTERKEYPPVPRTLHKLMPEMEDIARAESIKRNWNRDEELKWYQAMNSRDKDVYTVRFERFGDFLQVNVGREQPFVSRSIWTKSLPSKVAHTINLLLVNGISLVPGQPAQMGEQVYSYDNYQPEWCEARERWEPYFSLEYLHPTRYSLMDLEEKRVWPTQGSTSHLSGTLEAKQSVDDQIVFNGTHYIIYVPYGLGQSVLDKLHAAMRDGYES